MIMLESVLSMFFSRSFIVSGLKLASLVAQRVKYLPAMQET